LPLGALRQRSVPRHGSSHRRCLLTSGERQRKSPPSKKRRRNQTLKRRKRNPGVQSCRSAHCPNAPYRDTVSRTAGAFGRAALRLRPHSCSLLGAALGHQRCLWRSSLPPLDPVRAHLFPATRCGTAEGTFGDPKQIPKGGICLCRTQRSLCSGRRAGTLY
jgi:hypothetical protein